jgi:DNA-binding transcriptional regulator YhcF (GntR family)
VSRKPNRGGRLNAKGRNIGDGHHARLYRWMHRSPAFQHLTVGARALLIELKMLYTGQNNGELFLSVREAAKRLNIGKTHAAKCFVELEAHGFIRPKKVGDYKRSDAFRIKSAATRRGEATTWILTEHPIGEAVGAGSRDFVTWQPSPQQLADEAAKRLRRSAWRAKCPSRRTVRLKLVESVRHEGHLGGQKQVSRSATRHTDNIPWGVA